MTLALAIQAATGLEPGKDYLCQDDGDGVFLAKWITKAVPPPTQEQLDQYLAVYNDPVASAKREAEREKDRVLRSRAMEYLVGLMYQQELADAAKITALKTDIATEIAKVDVATVDSIVDTP